MNAFDPERLEVRRPLGLLIVCLAPLVARASPEDAAPEADEALRRLPVPRRAAEGPGPLDWVFERVESAADSWTTEQVSEEVGAVLKEIARWLEGGEAAHERVLAHLAPDFRGARFFVPELEEETVAERRGLRAWRAGRPCLDRDADREAWTAELSRLRSLAGDARKAKFKVFQLRRSGNGGAVTARALLEMDGVAPEGTFVQVRSIWDIDWTRPDGSWLITGVSRLEHERAELARRAFTDITPRALGGTAAYREQLLEGVEYWRTRIDAASGIDVYGHQGIAVGDVDGDGWDDFYVPQPAGLPNRLFRNLGNGRFEDSSSAAGVDVLDVSGGALFADLDNDGDPDLIVVTGLEVLLFENDGEGRFERREGTGLETSGLKSASTLGAAAADYDLDGDLDLYVFSYIFWAGGGSKLHSSYPYPYHDANNGAPNFLFRNDGRLRFRDVTAPAGMVVNNRRFSLAASWCDFDDDGDPDLYVANDFGKNNLYENLGDGRFRDVAEERGVEDTGNGMSVTWEDFDNDGRIDLYVGNMWSSAGNRIAAQPEFDVDALRSTYLRMARGNSLFRNIGGGRFEDVTIERGVQFGRWSWSAQFLDVDADGIEDLYVTNGFISNEKKNDL